VWVKTFGCAHNMSDGEYMAGLLQEYGYQLVADGAEGGADCWVVNTCTVKGPSQASMSTLLRRAREAGIPAVVAGCVPQGDKRLPELAGVSVLGVSQIDRVVEAVEQTLLGNRVSLLKKKALPRLDLPKVRRNRFVEIVPLSTGCKGACTYCKTKHARGELGSYDPEALVARVRAAVADPDVREVWLSSEDTGAYGIDLGTDIAALLRAILAVLPRDQSTALRVGMTNPPYILGHLADVAEVLRDPRVFSYLHVPVQSGSDAVLSAMRREYTRADFERVCDALLEEVPGMEIATDVIVGFPGETERDFEDTLRLLEKYRFGHTHVSQFYPRPGTPAARLRPAVPGAEKKARSRRCAELVDSWADCYAELVGTEQTVWVVDRAPRKGDPRVVGHTRGYVQVLLAPAPRLLGAVARVRVTGASRWHVEGELVEILHPGPEDAGEGAGGSGRGVRRADGARVGVAAAADGTASIAPLESPREIGGSRMPSLNERRQGGGDVAPVDWGAGAAWACAWAGGAGTRPLAWGLLWCGAVVLGATARPALADLVRWWRMHGVVWGALVP